jgi:hypothetical protein
MFWALLATGVIVALLGVPFGDDADTMDALAELTEFQRNFDRAKLESTLLAHASAQGVVRLADVAGAIGDTAPALRGGAASGRRGAPVTAAASAPPIQPDAGIALATLGQIHALGRSGSMLEIGSLSAETLALSLGWRLSRRTGAERFELQKVALAAGGCSDKDVEREREVAAARTELLQATSEADAAQKRYDDAEKLSEQRRKWKAPWKSILKADEKRAEARTALETAERTRAKNETRYETLAKPAEAKKRAAAKGARDGACALANATLRELPSGTTFTLQLPTPIVRRSVPVPPLTGVEFPVTRASGLWDEVEGSDTASALAQLRERFSWHYRYVEVSGVKVGGMTVLQLAPLALLPLFFGLIRRSRGVGALYNPFDRVSFEHLPSVGLGASPINLLVLVLLPLTACVLCAWSLIQVDQPPIVPALCALGCIGLGSLSHVALSELLELRDAITRSHSNPPPAPSAS